MNTAADLPAPSPRVSKGVLSQFLRTNCRRQLYLSIFAPHYAHADYAAQDLPPPAKWRPGLHTMKRTGQELEQIRYAEVMEAFADCSSNFKPTGKAATKTQTALLTALKGQVTTPHVFVEAQFESSALSPYLYEQLGIAPDLAAQLPPLADLRPDLILALAAHTPLPAARRPRRVLPNGETAEIAPDDTRVWLLPIDIKHAESINASYAVEVTLYAVLLSLWLVREGLDDRYVVVDQPALWTLDPPDAPALVSLKDIPPSERIATLLQRVEVVEFDQYVISMRKIFREDLVAAATVTNWTALEPHVGTYCNMCDFYAYPGWAPTDNKTGQKKAVHPEHCSAKTGQIDHLSRVPDMSRGMARTLRDGQVATVSALSKQVPDALVFQDHNRLAAERRLLPKRALHLVDGTSGTTGRQCATLPRFSNLSAYIVVNFDASTGFTTGFAIYGNYLPHREYNPDGAPLPPTEDLKRRPDAWTVERRDLDCEYDGLVRVVCYLYDLIEVARADERHEDLKKATLGVYFWDARQYEHFRTVVGRHLHRLLLEPKLKGLVWMFPPSDVLPHPEYAATPAIAFVKDAIRRLEILPIPHALTLLSVAGAVLQDPPKVSDYLHEPLSDAIPKERIYEIWDKGGHQNRQDQIREYNQTLRTMVMTLMRLTAHLQKTYKGALTATPPSLALMTLPEYRGVSMDGQLLILHAQLEDELQRTSTKVMYGRDPDELESEFTSMRLTTQLTGAAFDAARTTLALEPQPYLRIYGVTPTSHNSRLKVGEWVTFFIDEEPGLLNMRISRRLGHRPDLGKGVFKTIAEALVVEVVAFDQVAGLVAVAPTSEKSAEYLQPLVEALEDDGLDLTQSVSLVPSLSAMFAAHRKEQFVRALANPAIAQPYNQALAALAKQPAAAPKPGKDLPRRGAQMLWDTPTLAVEPSPHSADQIAKAIAWIEGQGHAINPSQREALMHSQSVGFSQLWGPPGTGKTKTGAAIAAAEVWLVNDDLGHSNLLITGPNYQAVETIYQDLLPLLAAQGPNACRVRWIKRRAAPGTIEKTLDYANYGPKELEPLHQALEHKGTPTVVFAVVHQLFALSGLPDKYQTKKSATPHLGLFDLVLIDEASQVDMAYACGPLVHLAPSGRLVLLGDRLQMPPITPVEPPRGVEFIVGSVLDYYHGRFRDLAEKPLLTNYRSSEALVAFARELGYPAELESAYPDTALVLTGTDDVPADWPVDLPWSDLFPALLAPERATMAVTYPDGKSGQANDFEATLVAATIALARRRVLAGLAGRGEPPIALADAERFWTQTVGIVTPHRAQRSAIIRKLRSLFPNDDATLIEAAVDTVERFQGGERDIILVSFGVGDPDVIELEEEFLLGLNRTNVAISRARAKVIVFVSDDLSYHLPDDAEIVRTARAVKGFVHQYCHEQQTIVLNNRTVTLRWRNNPPKPDGS